MSLMSSVFTETFLKRAQDRSFLLLAKYRFMKCFFLDFSGGKAWSILALATPDISSSEVFLQLSSSRGTSILLVNNSNCDKFQYVIVYSDC